ncbi:hypothetical protein ACFL0N_01960, partial [Pseudomonadota bacterium]
MKKILIVDNNPNNRKEQLRCIAVSLDGVDVDAKSTITEFDYKSAEYDIALIHLNNPECRQILGKWKRPETQLVVFSGEWSAITPGDIYFFGARLIEEEPDRVKRLLRELI